MTEVAGPPVPPERFSSLAIRGEDEAIDDDCGPELIFKRNMAAVFEVLLRKPNDDRARLSSDTNLRPTLKHLLTVCPVPARPLFRPPGRTRICVQPSPTASSENIRDGLFTIAWVAI